MTSRVLITQLELKTTRTQLLEKQIKVTTAEKLDIKNHLVLAEEKFMQLKEEYQALLKTVTNSQDLYKRVVFENESKLAALHSEVKVCS